MNEDEMLKGKGGIKDIPDPRDYQFSVIAGSLPPFDWDKGYDIEEVLGKKLNVKDQNGSSSCGGQAWSALGQALDPDHDEKSAKFIYAQTHVPGGGSDGRTNCNLVIKKGWGKEMLTPSYQNGMPAGEQFYTNLSDITQEAYNTALLDKALSYANVPIDIESVAIAIRENKGCIIGITGKNNGTWLTKFPIRPDAVDASCWNHWVFVGKAKIVNGKKMIGFMNSWGASVGEQGWQWIDADYLRYPYVWSVWTLVYNFPVNIPPYVFTKNLWRGLPGMQVNDVIHLQLRLNKEVVPTIKVDGQFGNQTKQAVIKFQLAHGLVGDGKVGPKTNEELNK